MSDLLKEFADFAQEAGYRVRTDYSGRAMYGKKCLAVVGDEAPLGTILEFISCELENRVYHGADDSSNEICMDHGDYSKILDFMNLMRSTMASDNMGRQAVYYWPGIDFEARSDADDESGNDKPQATRPEAI